ncbi:MAG: hypothetical protein ACFFCS_12370, partial [Candidatus Hodarchaeota archaeon]
HCWCCIMAESSNISTGNHPASRSAGTSQEEFVSLNVNLKIPRELHDALERMEMLLNRSLDEVASILIINNLIAMEDPELLQFSILSTLEYLKQFETREESAGSIEKDREEKDVGS